MTSLHICNADRAQPAAPSAFAVSCCRKSSSRSLLAIDMYGVILGWLPLTCTSVPLPLFEATPMTPCAAHHDTFVRRSETVYLGQIPDLCLLFAVTKSWKATSSCFADCKRRHSLSPDAIDVQSAEAVPLGQDPPMPYQTVQLRSICGAA